MSYFLHLKQEACVNLPSPHPTGQSHKKSQVSADMQTGSAKSCHSSLHTGTHFAYRSLVSKGISMGFIF